MARTVSATAAKNGLGALIESIGSGEGEVIVENRGEPVVAIISIAAYEDLKKIRLDERRKNALEKLLAVQARVRAKNPDLTKEDVAQLSKRVVDDTLEAMGEKNLVGFEQ